jgi:hypothetical protein
MSALFFFLNPRADGDVQRRFVATALPAYVARKSMWDIFRCLLAFRDARAEEDFLETRGLKLVAVMEMVENSLVAAEGVGAALDQGGWRKDERAIVYENLSSLNRVAFRNHLILLRQRLELSLSDDEIRLLVRCRCQRADDGDRRVCPPHGSPVEEYLCLLRAIDLVFLRLVDYKGPWIDWSEVGNPKRLAGL